MNRTFLRRDIACVAALLFVGSTFACTDDEPEPPRTPTASVTVDANGGIFPDINGVGVTVPAGTIGTKTELSISAPKRMPSTDAPFGKTSTRIDISFKDGSQPSEGKPLEVQIPLAIAPPPTGVTPMAALLYHRTHDGNFRVLPSIVLGDRLHAKLPHLSEWDVAYLDSATLNGYKPTEYIPTVPAKCTAGAQSKNTGKVKVGGKGWSVKGDSPVHACLIANSDNPVLSITNNMNYLMPIAATDGLKLHTSSKDAEEDMVRLIAGKVFPDKRVKGYLGRDGYATTPITASSLPATVELIGDPSTFLAESAWFALKFMVGIFVGKPGNQVEADVKFVLDSTEVLTCIKSTLDISQGKTPSMGDVAELLTSKCTQQIANALGARAANSNAWDQFWGRFFTVGGAFVDGWDNFRTAIDGIRLQFNGTISITVQREVVCPSASQFQATAKAHSLRKYGGSGRVKATMRGCHQGWAYGSTQPWLTDYNMWGDGLQTVMHWNGSGWTVDHMVGSDGLIIGEDAVCGKMPATLRKQLCRAI